MENYNHYNRALGRRIYNRKDYIQACKELGAVPQSEVQRAKPKEYKPSKELYGLAKAINEQSDKKGNFKPSPVLRDALKKKGVNLSQEAFRKAQKAQSKGNGQGGVYSEQKE